MEDLRVSTPTQREKAASGLECGGSTQRLSSGPAPTLPGLPDHDLCLWAAPVGRRAPASQRDRWRTPRAAYLPGKRGQGSLYPFALGLSENVAPTLAEPPQPAVDVSLAR